jgi:hypothetical protein
MKFIALAILASLTTSTAHAFESISCIGNEVFGTSKRVNLTLSAPARTIDDVEEGVEVPYEYLFTTDGQTWAKGLVQVSQEDVVVTFHGRNRIYGEMMGRIYLDELDQSSISLNGIRLNLNCGAAAN